MGDFIFSCDGHILEPSDLFPDKMPASLRDKALRVEVRGEHRFVLAGTDVIVRSRIIPDIDARRQKMIGARDLARRRIDLAEDGVDAELLFPQMALFTHGIRDAEVESAHAQIYNDWVRDLVWNERDMFVAAAILPVRNLDNTLAEMKRAKSLGFTTLMLPSVTPPGVPAYNDERWEPVFELGGELHVVFAMHTGTGLEGGPVVERGRGGAIINYTRQMVDAVNSTMYLVAGGVLDRHPKSRVAFVECGASWLGAVAERMDEVAEAHNAYVRPKLSRKPSQIIRDQVKATFQHDRECIMGRKVTGHEAIMWAADYPHLEGTFPKSREVIEGLFEGLDVPARERADIIGGTAARFFGLQHPNFQAPAEGHGLGVRHD